MKIKLKKKENQYAQVHVNMLRDRTLSLKAKGLGAVLESYSNDFEVSLKSIEMGSYDGIKSVRAGIKELEEGYYLFRFQTRDEAGLFITYWAFDSQKLEVDYLKSIIKELVKVELITKNELSNGVSVLATPTGYPLTASRSTASRQSTTYNNNTYKNKRDKNITLSGESKRENIFKSLQSFKSHFITKNIGELFYTQGIGFAAQTAFTLNSQGFILNTVNQKILSKEEALTVWQYLYDYYKAQKEQKTA